MGVTLRDFKLVTSFLVCILGENLHNWLEMTGEKVKWCLISYVHLGQLVIL